jgi:hypothetical protein
MKRSYWGVIALCLLLLGNIALTQYAVNMYFYEKYSLTILLALLNIALFPVAFYIYRNGGKYG